MQAKITLTQPPPPQPPSHPNPIPSSVRQTQSQKMLVTVNGEREDCLTCKDGRSARRTTTYSSKRIPEGYTPFCQCVDVWGFAYCVIVNLRFKARIIADHNQNIPSFICESSSREHRQGPKLTKKEIYAKAIHVCRLRVLNVEKSPSSQWNKLGSDHMTIFNSDHK